MVQRGLWSREAPKMGLPGAARLLALKEREQELPPLWQYVLQARIRQTRLDIVTHKRRLNDAIKQLDEYDRLLGSFEQEENDGGDGAGDEPFSSYRVESRIPERSQAELHNGLNGIFEDLLVKDADKGWVKTDEGLRVPTAKAVNAARAELGFEPLSDKEVKEAYISYLNGDY